MKLKNKVALITGASRGIGRAIALSYAREGAKVCINYKDSVEKAQGLQKEIIEIGGECTLCQADISIATEVEWMIKKIISQYEKIDILVNNAGIAEYKMFTDISEKDWDAMMDVHVKGMFHCSQKTVKYMLMEGEGKIINISSVWGMVGASYEVHYSTAKGAVIAFTKALAKELAPSGILVNCIAPGVIETDMLKELEKEDLEDLKVKIPLGRLGTAENVAALAVFLAQEEANYITGQIMSPNGGFVI